MSIPTAFEPDTSARTSGGLARAAAAALLCICVAGLSACQTAEDSGGEAETAQAEERPATKAEIEAVAVGNTVNGAMTYNEDGSYLYQGGNPGRYTIRNGQICVRFESGGARCDRIVTDGSGLTMINGRNGSRAPFG